jgi:hypothetical protein
LKIRRQLEGKTLPFSTSPIPLNSSPVNYTNEPETSRVKMFKLISPHGPNISPGSIQQFQERKINMRHAWAVVLCLAFSGISFSQEAVKVFAQGDSSRLPDFVESFKREFGERGMKLQVVRPDEGYDYNIVVAQESSLSGAAAAVIALDSKGLFIASVVRSGRWSGKGAFNASAKELTKKLMALRNH